jgi:magnesium-protoporphyrin IX monomethyl ester (oxidative) cyclase
MAFNRILLVNPGKKSGLGFVNDVIPIGLEYIAASIERDVEKVWILDMGFESQSYKNQLDALKPDLVGLTISATDHSEALKLAGLAKKSGAVTVLGGYHPTAIPGELLSQACVDIVVRGEGELTMKDLVRRGSPEGVFGASYKVKDQVIHNPDRLPIRDLDSLPFPARHLRRNKYMRRMNRDGRDYDVITMSRGCWGTCVFCCEPYMSGKHMRFRSPENIMSELFEVSAYHEGRPMYLLVTDPHFMGDPERTDRLCDLLHESDLDAVFSVMTRGDSVAANPGLVEKMCDNGILNYELGIESPDQRDLNEVKKGVTLETQRRAVEILRENGANVSGTMVIGLPDQSEEEMKRFPVFAKEIGLMNCAFGIATPFPGTEFYEKLELKELIFERDWAKYDEMHSVYRLNSVGPEELEKLESYCMARFWTLNTFMDRASVTQKRTGKKVSLGDFVGEILGKLAFVGDAGCDLRGGDIRGHVDVFLDAMMEAEAEEIGRKILVGDVIEASRFFKILGSQTIQVTLRYGEKSAGYLIKTTRENIDSVKIVGCKQSDATINIDVDLDRTMDAFERDSPLGILNSVSTLRNVQGVSGVFNIFRLYVALTTEIGSTYLGEKLRVIG